MNFRILKIVFLFIFFLFAQNRGVAQEQDSVMIVGIAGSEPFINDTFGDEGISAEIWEQLADRMNWEFRTVYFDNISVALESLKNGDLDAVVGPISITSQRAEYVNFTLPYFQSSLSILSREEDLNIWKMLAPFFSKEFYIAVTVFLFILAIIGGLLWLAEKNSNPEQFPKDPKLGIANGMWCAIVTMTTTGYGDIVPRTFWGRFLAGVWMVISLILATTMIAGIAGTITLSGMKSTAIKDAGDLKGKLVATKVGSPAIEFIKMNGGKVLKVNYIDEGIQKLEEKSVSAVVFDRPQLLYRMRQQQLENLIISTAEFQKQGYGFAFPLSFPNLHDVNVALLELKEDGIIDRTITKWLGSNH